MTEKVSLKSIKKADNKLTFALGYRNLLNIVVLSTGFVGIVISPAEAAIRWIALVIFILGAKWTITQMQENIDSLEVSEI